MVEQKSIVIHPPTKWSKFALFSGRVLDSVVWWKWTKTLLYWIVISAGTASELFFLLASIWVSVNANVHPFVLTLTSEAQATKFTYWATTGFVALPECIVGLAMITTIGHIKMWKKGGYISVLWSILFGVPTVIFLILSLVTIGCSVANVTFIMPTFFVVVRALSAFVFAFSAFLYEFLGKPQEHERLAEKDSLIAALRAEMTATLANLSGEKEKIIAALVDEKQSILSKMTQEKESLLSTIDAKNDEIESLKSLLSETQKGFTELHKAMQKSADSALQGYSEECINWVNSGVKSVPVEDIMKFTGHPKRKINRAILGGLLQPSPRNKDLILMSSLVEWLKQTPVKSDDSDPELLAVHA